ncbi:MAG: four helix bundle protein [Bacteroidetes bacterium]|nr:four helix bundle protein [Bacteroidota bacterium]MBU1422001.1 four helix bundle protein [Bacteroidota bacterium]MBU2471268.1 four helix bundle protein [Bacteroidota bacterium]MBU2636125.1 four helix bundle protein [Bacteroidota bacterium]
MVTKFIDDLPKDKSCEIIGNQLLRSSTSIGANVVEAGAASSRKDFTNFFNHALKSANESKFWLALLKDSGKASKELCDKLLEETNQISNILASSILTLKGKK